MPQKRPEEVYSFKPMINSRSTRLLEQKKSKETGDTSIRRKNKELEEQEKDQYVTFKPLINKKSQKMTEGRHSGKNKQTYLFDNYMQSIVSEKQCLSQ